MQITLFISYENLVFFNKKIKYATKIRLIMYVIVEIEINIAFVISIISGFAKKLKSDHFSTVPQILRYLAGS